MTVSVPGQLVYSSQGDGVTTEFTYPVRFEAASELVVISREDGVDTVLMLNTDYTVAGAGLDAGGTVTMLYTPTAAEEIVRYRDTAAKQIVNLADSTRNPAEAVENQLDRFAMKAQDQDERIARTIRVAAGNPPLKEFPGVEAGMPVVGNDGEDGLVFGEETYNGLRGRVDAVETKNTEQDGRLDAVESTNATQNSRLTDAEGRLDANDTTNASQNSRLDSVESHNTTQDGRLDTVEGLADRAWKTPSGTGGSITAGSEGQVARFDASGNLAGTSALTGSGDMLSSAYDPNGWGGRVFPFESRAEVEASNIPAPVLGLSLIHNGWLLHYLRDAAGTALTTNGGTVNWSPAGLATVFHWGAEGDGSTDDTTKIQAAIDFLETKSTTEFGQYGGGGSLLFPKGEYVVSSTLTIQQSNVVLRGEGTASAVIKNTGTNISTLEVYAADYETGGNLRGFGLIDLTFIYAGSDPNDGAHIDGRYISESFLERCNFVNHHRGIWCRGIDEGVHIENCLVQQGGNTTTITGRTTAAGLVLEALVVDATHPNAVEDPDNPGTYYKRNGSVHLSNCEIKGNRWGMNHAVDVRAVDGFYIDSCHIAWALSSCMRIKPSVGGMPIFNIHCANTLFDSNAGNIGDGTQFTMRGLLYENTPAIINQAGVCLHRYTNCSFSGQDDKALWVQSGFDNLFSIKFTGCTFKNSSAQGTLLQSGRGFVFSGCEWENNDTDASGQAHFQTDGASGVVVSGGRVFDGAASFGFGIAGSDDDIVIEGAIVEDVSTQAVTLKTTGKNIRISVLSDTSDTVASGGTIVVKPELNTAYVTGTTTINNIADNVLDSNSSWEGRRLNLIFDGALTLANGTGNLRLGADVVTSQYMALSLVHRGGFWYKLAA